MNKLLIFLPAFFLFACNNTYPDNGGACTYVTDTVGATIVRLDSNGTAYPDMMLHVTQANGEIDSIRYPQNNGEVFTWDSARARGYKVGLQLKTRHELRTSGHCTPEIFVVTKEILE